MKNAIIKIKGTQHLGGEKDVTELITTGTFQQNGNTFILTYEEGQNEQQSACVATLTATGEESVVMEKKGEINSKLIIEKGVRNNCFYNIPQCNLVLGIYGKSINNRLHHNGGTLNMEYAIDSNLQPVSTNEIEISVKITEE